MADSVSKSRARAGGDRGEGGDTIVELGEREQ